jgi:hypothetical protein
MIQELEIWLKNKEMEPQPQIKSNRSIVSRDKSTVLAPWISTPLSLAERIPYMVSRKPRYNLLLCLVLSSTIVLANSITNCVCLIG